MNQIYKSVLTLKNKIRPTHLSDQEIIVLHEYRAIYFAIPKVASSSWHRICAILLNLEIPEIALEKERRVDNLPEISRLETLRYQDYFKFCFVRNPWDRLVSCYKDKIREDRNFNSSRFHKGVDKGLSRFGTFRAGMAFEEFIEAIADIPDAIADRHFRSQYSFITDPSGSQLVDFVGKIENSEQDFYYVLNRLNRTDIEIPHFKMSREKDHYKEYYTDKLKQKVARRYQKDIDLFQYCF